MKTVKQKSRSDRQIRSYSLLLYFLASVLIHGLVILAIALLERSQPTAKQKQDITPIDFVFVPPEKTPVKPPPETKRRAVNNSVAQGKIKSKRPPIIEEENNTGNVSSPKVTPSKKQAQKPPISAPVKTNPPVAVKPRSIEPSQPPTPQNSVADRTPPLPKPTLPVVPKPRSIEPPQLPTPQNSVVDRTASKLKPSPLGDRIISKKNDLPSRANRLPSQTKPLQSAPQSQNLPKTPTRPTPPTSSVARKTPTNSGAANLLGGNYQRSIQQDSGSSFFTSETDASKEAPYAKLDARQDDLAPYFAEIRRKVKRNWQPVSPSEERYTVLAFAIERSGKISQLKVVETSGDEQVDRDALEAIQKAAPFSNLPQSYPSDRLEITFSFNIYIRQGSFSPSINPW
ncbi:MAG: TonB family protein [Xenococcaceae cyanobacterium]